MKRETVHETLRCAALSSICSANQGHVDHQATGAVSGIPWGQLLFVWMPEDP